MLDFLMFNYIIDDYQQLFFSILMNYLCLKLAGFKNV